MAGRAGGGGLAERQVGARVVRTATETATDLIRHAIMDGRLRPGQRLREVELAAEFGISRTPIREALLILQAEGSVEAAPNRGAWVRDIGLDEVLDYVEVVSVLHEHAAFRAASRITGDQLDLMEANWERLKALGSDDMIAVADERLALFEIMVDAAASPGLRHTIGMLTRLPIVYRLHAIRVPGVDERSLRQQRDIIDALRAHDPDAARDAMRRLTASVLATVRSVHSS